MKVKTTKQRCSRLNEAIMKNIERDVDRDNRATLGEDAENLTSLVDKKADFGVEPTTAFTPSTSDAIQNYKRTKKLMNKNFKAQRDITGKFVKDQNKRINNAKTEDVKIVSEIALEDFDFWAGAKYVAGKLSHDDFVQIEDYLNEIYPDGMTKTEVNDFFWFEDDTIADILGYDSWEDLEETRENDGGEDDIDEALSPTATTLATTLGAEIIKNPVVLDKLGNLVKTISDASPISKAIEAAKEHGKHKFTESYGGIRKYTQKELRDLVRDGYAEDISSMPAEETYRRFPSGSYRQIGYSSGTYGINGGLIEDTHTGDWYAIIGKTPALLALI